MPHPQTGQKCSAWVVAMSENSTDVLQSEDIWRHGMARRSAVFLLLARQRATDLECRNTRKKLPELDDNEGFIL